jgi:hypothetical protein
MARLNVPFQICQIPSRKLRSCILGFLVCLQMCTIVSPIIVHHFEGELVCSEIGND